MNINTYIQSGILELYVLNLLEPPERAEVQDMICLYPSIKEEVEKLELKLEADVRQAAVTPPSTLKEKIYASIQEMERAKQVDFDWTALGLIDQNTDYKAWYQAVCDRYPKAFQQDNYFKILREDATAKQLLVVSSSDVAEESHDDTYESFLILKGKCMCTVESDTFFLEPGGFTQIPLHTRHQVKIVKGPVVAVVQYIALF
ncbi:hypothetical protein H8S90_14280 [Olivibacter sp. SDN3]|uniref:hypothetical protein n=1 Tax=Olivibacter sp. SDN3 TaxID=2764720 RepID=UPI00165143AE|nr:hypothetical protein [Olivibacter sp. SDN3]QNL47978.1 hypothetical protein H8S90_14280 [Olivibacter sp. SDN3]